jgi:stage II sporulation protein D
MRLRVLSVVAAALLVARPAAAAPTAHRELLPPVCSGSCVAAATGSGTLFLFSGHGWGHGVGMSQYGAYGYALHGSSYQQILAHYYPGTSLGSTQANLIRVLLADRKKTLKIACSVPFTVTDGNGATHTLAAGALSFGPGLRLRVDGGQTPQALTPPLTFNAGAGGWLTLGRAYRGQITVDVVDARLRAVNVVGLEQYLYGVVPAEMPSTWPAEALEAQAVAARSYALATRRLAAPFDVYADARSQVYLGVSRESAATTAAVDATKGVVAMFGSTVATTYFFSSSGGETESISDAWGQPPLSYLVAVPDPWDVLSPYHNWGPIPVSALTLERALKLQGETVTDLQTTLDPSGRVGSVSLITAPELAPADVTGGKLSGALGLRSTWFDVTSLSLQQPAPGAPIPYGSGVTLAGWIHGVWGVSLEQRVSGGSWHLVGPIAAAADGSLQLAESPTITTDYRLATPAAAVGYVRVRVTPVVTLAAPPTPGQVQGSVQPVLPGATVAVQQQGSDLKWATIADGAVAADGSFIVPVEIAPGTTYRVLVSPGHGYWPGATPAQVATG